MKPYLLLALLAVLSACRDTTELTDDAARPSTEVPALKTQTLLTNQEIIWGMDFLPTGELIFTEKRGKIYRFANGTTTELTGLPTDINTTGQGGLLDVRVHPNYASNGWVYASYANKPAGSAGARLSLIRFKISGNQLTGLETIFNTDASNTSHNHYGSRIEFDRSGMLYLSVGEGGTGSYGGESSFNKNAQNTSLGWGKVHRMTDAGQVPADNPVLPGQTAPGTLFTYGHRNPQGLVLNPTTGELWATEHGARGGDEVNRIQKGSNYGWPLVSHGVNYDGVPISASPTREGIQAPVHTWTPSIGPSGLAFITSDKFKGLKGSLVAGGLAIPHLSVMTISEGRVTNVIKLLEGQGRIRNVRQGPDGNLYVALESPGRIVQIIPE